MTQSYVYSSDHLTWLMGTIPTTMPFSDLTYANGIFFASKAFSGNSPRPLIATSTTGLPASWTVQDLTTLIGGLNWVGPVYWVPSASLYFAIVDADTGSSGQYITSPDAVTWTLRSFPTVNSFFHFMTTPSFGLVTNTIDSTYPASRAYSSPDLITWTNVGVATGLTAFIASEWSCLQGNGSERYFYSPDLVTWSNNYLSTYGYISAGGVILGKFVSAGYGFPSPGVTPTANDFIFTSDGVTWSSSSTPNPANSYYYRGIADDGTTALLVGDGVKAYSTANLTAWSTILLPKITSQYTAIAHGAGEWVALGPNPYGNSIVMVI